MRDTQVYTAYLFSENQEFGAQLLRVAFEYKIIDYWGEPEAQKELKEYFKAAHYTHEEPLIVEESEMFDIMPYDRKHAKETA